MGCDGAAVDVRPCVAQRALRGLRRAGTAGKAAAILEAVEGRPRNTKHTCLPCATKVVPVQLARPCCCCTSANDSAPPPSPLPSCPSPLPHGRSMCLYAGINISGVNAEVLPSQWEYQVGGARGGPSGRRRMVWAGARRLREAGRGGTGCAGGKQWTWRSKVQSATSQAAQPERQMSMPR